MATILEGFGVGEILQDRQALLALWPTARILSFAKRLKLKLKNNGHFLKVNELVMWILNSYQTRMILKPNRLKTRLNFHKWMV